MGPSLAPRRRLSLVKGITGEFHLPSFQEIPAHIGDDTIDATSCSESASGSLRSSDNSGSLSSYTSAADAIALRVGRSAHHYLQECFYTEVSILDRDKFDAVPEIVKSDLTISRHLGKGSYSDVFEVIYTEAEFGDRSSSSAVPGSTWLEGERPPARGRRATVTMTAPSNLARPAQNSGRRRVLAMKCLRPQIRSDATRFTVGAEDLVHETAILANLNHPNIIKLHGRATGHLADAFVLNDGYFILLDRLSETLKDRIDSWKVDPVFSRVAPIMKQIEVAHTVADAMAYLHSKKIIFRDLKPDNVGFDSMGVVKLFDFGFAIGVPENDVIFHRCGTPRYMSPEVGIGSGYSLPADVYSFGVLLWEICALKKPFGHIKSADEFEKSVFVDGERPPLGKRWPRYVKEIMISCWSVSPRKRPTMVDVKSALQQAMDLTNKAETKKKDPWRRRLSLF